MANEASLPDKMKMRSKSRIHCRLQSNDDILFENELHEKLMYHFGRGVRITQSIIQECADELKNDFPSVSNIGRRWIESFLSKKGYAYKRVRGSKGLIPKADIENCRTEIRAKTAKYSPMDCINIDESGITPYAGSNYSYQLDEPDGSAMGRTERNSKWRFTSVIGIDGIGRCAFKPVFIIRNCHRGLAWSEMKHKILENGIHVYDSSKALYYIQANAWMNSVIWCDLMIRYNSFLVAQNRKVLLVVDNFSGHKIQTSLSNIEMAFLKPNLTSVLQPADLMVISTIKKRYNKWYNRQILNETENTHGQILSKFGHFQSTLEPEIGLTAWRKSGLIESYDDQDDDSDVSELDIVDDDIRTPISSQNMTNELVTLNLNDSQSQPSETTARNKNLIQSSISSFFCKK